MNQNHLFGELLNKKTFDVASNNNSVKYYLTVSISKSRIPLSNAISKP